jgi:hypothetical protein
MTKLSVIFNTGAEAPGVNIRESASHLPAWPTMNSNSKHTCGILLVFFSTLLIGVPAALANREICVAEDGLKVCVQMRGPCDISHLVPRETNKMKMDMLYVSIENKSSHRIKVSPQDFYGITTEGHILAVDASFYDDIELKTKLRSKDLAPEEHIQGFLFFPSCFGLVRSLVHSPYPLFEIQMF